MGTNRNGIDDCESRGVGVPRVPFLLYETKILASAVRRSERKPLTDDQKSELHDWVHFLRIVKGLSENTCRVYLDSTVSFLVWINHWPLRLSQVTGATIEAWLKHLYLERHHVQSTRSKDLVAIRQYFTWRESRGLGINPARSIPGPRKEKRAPRKFSRKQLHALFRTMDRKTIGGRRDFAVLLLFLSTGARRSEIAELCMSDLIMDSRQGGVRLMGKGRKERIVGFGGPVVPALSAWLVDRQTMGLPDREAVFVGLKGINKGLPLGIAGLDGVIRRAIRKAGISVEPGMALHGLRSTYATAMYDQGEDIEQIRALLGHDNIETTRGYLAISDRRLKARLSGPVLRDFIGD